MPRLRRHPLILFFVLAYLLSWLVWGTAIAQAYGWLAWRIPQTLAFWGLIFATYISAAVVGGWPAMRDVLLRVGRWRVGVAWYLAAALLPAALGFAALGLNLLISGPNRIGAELTLPQFLVFALSETIFMIFTEETAWRGFALPRLQARRSALAASLILGLLWGLWHIPLFLIPGSAQASYPFLGFLLLILPTSVLTTWLFNHTNGSVLLAGIFHGVYDATVVFLGVLTSGTLLFWLFVGVSWAAALAVVAAAGAGRLSRGCDLSGTTMLDSSAGAPSR